MKPLIIKATVWTPSVILDASNNKFEISGKSLPENVVVFYKPVKEWFESYSKNPNPKTDIVIKFLYLNTASQKMIYSILRELGRKFDKKGNISVKWYYNEDSEDIKEIGEDFAEMLDFAFEVVRY
ncbi:MAG: DUF1987 domain-containing protein [Bacteroidetes bacterium]|nr:DUF1987 domain-containing protein [Bacteroidota bacterium]